MLDEKDIPCVECGCPESCHCKLDLDHPENCGQMHHPFTPPVIARACVQREGEQHEDDVECHRIEIEFAIPVFIPQGALRELNGLLSSIVRMKTNQLKGHAHWVSGYGSKPLWSQADARFLGKTPADDAPLRGEPSFDNSVYHIETSCIERAERQP